MTLWVLTYLYGTFSVSGDVEINLPARSLRKQRTLRSNRQSALSREKHPKMDVTSRKNQPKPQTKTSINDEGDEAQENFHSQDAPCYAAFSPHRHAGRTGHRLHRALPSPQDLQGERAAVLRACRSKGDCERHVWPRRQGLCTLSNNIIAEYVLPDCIFRGHHA